MPDIKQACFLQDEASQILALSDALASANGPAIAEAFDAVARTRGLAQIAQAAGVSLDDLHRALADPARPDIGFLKHVLTSLANQQPDPGVAQALATVPIVSPRRHKQLLRQANEEIKLAAEAANRR